MATEIKIPVPDQTTEEVRIVSWKKATGDAVVKGDVVLEVETDKSVIEVEATGDGVLLKTLKAEDDMVPVGEVVGLIGEPGEKVEIAAAEKPSPTSVAPAAPSGSGSVTLAEGLTKVKIPVPDQTTEEVRIVSWKKAAGDAVAKGDVVLEVETDKSVIEVEATGDGVLLKTLKVEDDMVPVGQVVGVIGPAGATVDVSALSSGQPSAAPAAESKPAAAAPVTVPAVSSEDGHTKASPVAKKLAAKLGINISQVTGSGPGGRITKQDVENLVATGAPAVAAAPVAVVHAGGRIFSSPNARRIAKELGVDFRMVAGSGPNGRITGTDVQQFSSSGPKTAAIAPAVAPLSMSPVNGQPQPGTEESITKMRRAIGLNLQRSFRDTPHFMVTMSIDMTRASAFRNQFNQSRQKPDRLSVNDLVLKAAAVALRHYPTVNSRLAEDKTLYLADVNIGIATAIETGLVVPVVMNTDKLDWQGLAHEAKRVSSEARNGKIIGAGKGTFTVSNLGMFGVDEFTAIINPPESAILAVGGVTDTVVAIDGMIAIRPMMKVTLCSDHRVVDGALAAEFLRSVKVYLEDQIG